jgi:hypothetical protein
VAVLPTDHHAAAPFAPMLDRISVVIADELRVD